MNADRMIDQLIDVMMSEEKMKDSIFGASLYVHRKEDSILTTRPAIAAISVHCHVKNVSRSQMQQQKKEQCNEYAQQCNGCFVLELHLKQSFGETLYQEDDAFQHSHR